MTLFLDFLFQGVFSNRKRLYRSEDHPLEACPAFIRNSLRDPPVLNLDFREGGYQRFSSGCGEGESAGLVFYSRIQDI